MGREQIRGLVIWAALVASGGLLLFGYRYLDALATGKSEAWAYPLITEMTGALAAGLLFFPVRLLVRRCPLDRLAWPRQLPVYVAAAILFGVADTSLMWAMRIVLFRLAGMGAYDYGIMPLRYLMEFPVQLIGFSIMVGAIHAAHAFRTARRREVQAARLESNLARAELRNLRLQLQPHFLFNALNTISATMYRDPASADEMLDQLAELLRASLQTMQTDEVPLRAEIEILERYLALMRARFGDGLRVSTCIDAEASEALVPCMLLQPLVENAIRHGNVSRLGTGTIEVRAQRLADRLVLEVEDDGPGVPSGDDSVRSGVGLSATAERLQLLYGDAHRLVLGNGGLGGFQVQVFIPIRTPEGAPS